MARRLGILLGMQSVALMEVAMCAQLATINGTLMTACGNALDETKTLKSFLIIRDAS